MTEKEHKKSVISLIDWFIYQDELLTAIMIGSIDASGVYNRYLDDTKNDY